MIRSAFSRGLLALVVMAAGLVAAAPTVGTEPQLTVRPDRTIVDGETITLRGTGFPPGQLAAAAQCRSELLDDADVGGHCDIGNFTLGTVGANGVIRLQLQARRFIEVSGEPVDCAVPGSCITGISSTPGSISPGDATVTWVELVFDDTIANDPPLEIDAQLTDWTSRRVELSVRCSRPATLGIEGRIDQPRRASRATVRGSLQVACDEAVETSVLLVPRDRSPGDANRFPRLLRGPGKLSLTINGRARRWNDSEIIRRTLDIDQPRLTEHSSQPHDGDEIDVQGLRISPTGRAVARVGLVCAQPQPSYGISVVLLSDGPAGTHRRMIGNKIVDTCTGEMILDVPLDRGAGTRRDDIIEPGRAEIYAQAVAFPFRSRFGPVAMRPLTTNRTIKPASILGIRHNHDSRVRIGRATVDGVRGAVRCGRTAVFTVFATIGQPIGSVVHRDEQRAVVRCVEGRTITFDIGWSRPMRPDIRSAIQLRAINGKWITYDGPWQQIQRGWRTT